MIKQGIIVPENIHRTDHAALRGFELATGEIQNASNTGQDQEVEEVLGIFILRGDYPDNDVIPDDTTHEKIQRQNRNIA